jgi:hypothetical protein
MKEVKVLSINLDKRQVDMIEDVTNNEIHRWIKNDRGGIDLYVTMEITRDDFLENRARKKGVIYSF